MNWREKREVADGEIFHGTGGLGAVVGVGGDFHFAHGVSFESEIVIHKEGNWRFRRICPTILWR